MCTVKELTPQLWSTGASALSVSVHNSESVIEYAVNLAMFFYMGKFLLWESSTGSCRDGLESMREGVGC